MGQNGSNKSPDDRPKSMQPHYTAKEIGKMWGISESTAFRIFREESGVLRIGDTNARRRTKISLRIPQDVLDRVWLRMTR
jgi:hypothetical protein